MAIINTDTKVKISGDGVTREFGFDFKIYAKADLKVWLIDKTSGDVEEKSLTTDYKVTLNRVDEGGVIEFVTLLPPSADVWVFMFSDMPYTQNIVLPTDGAFREKKVSNGMDRLCRLIQQNREAIGRAIQVPRQTEGETPDYDTLIDDAKAAAEEATTEAEGYATDASGYANTALGHANTALGYANTALGHANTALGYANDASGYADDAQEYALSLTGTSSTPVTIGTGEKVFTTQEGKQFNVGHYLLVVDTANSDNYMFGSVTGYSGTTLTIEVIATSGAGTISSWSILVSGIQGAKGDPGNVNINGTPDLAAPAVADEILLSDTDDSNTVKKSDLDAILALYDSKTSTLTNKTFDANGTGNSLSNVDVADLANGTDGELITWAADATPTTVAAGTADQVLTSNGAGAAPTFQDNNSAKLNPSLYNRDIQWLLKTPYSTTANRYTIQSPNKLAVDIGGVIYFIESQTDIDLSSAANWDTNTPTDYTVAANRAGKDFYIYACQPASGTTPVIKLSANSTVPSGYTVDNSRKIGGFHCLCVAVGTIAEHTLTGFAAGDVLPASIWDLDHRPVCSPEGMVFSEAADIWVDIYLASGTGASTASVYGGTISDSRNWMDFVDDFGAVKKQLLNDIEFQLIAAGSNEETNISGSVDPGTTGGHSDTASRRMISNIGCEDCAGAMWQWLDEQSVRWDPTTPGWGWYDLPGAKGSLYNYGGASATGADVKLLAGGAWGSAAACGSRCRLANISRWNAGTSIGGRGRSRKL
jgi:hypothetical protein